MATTSALFTISGTPGDDYLIGTHGDDLLEGGDGNDWMLGLAGNDTLVGGSGFDQLDGGSGDDTYVFAPGDGFDVIWEGSGSSDAGGFDTVKLTGEFGMVVPQLWRAGDDLVIGSQYGDDIIVREHFLSGGQKAIEQITFSDGTIWDSSAINARVASMNSNVPTEGSDTLVGSQWGDYLAGLGGNDTISGGQGDDYLTGGTGNDRLFGGEGGDTLYGDGGNDLLAGGVGNDYLNGGSGNDTYLFNLGDGLDRIEEYPVYGETNRVIFGQGIRFEDLRATLGNYYGNSSVIIDIGSAGDQLELLNSTTNPYGSHSIDTFHFSDGTIATFDALAGYGVYFRGQQWDEWFSGSYYADSLYGNAGNDTLYGYSGNDILAGGQGNDYLSGGAGDDVYLFNSGDGFDFIDDYAFPAEGNRVRFGSGITVDDLRLRLDGGVMVRIEVGNPGDILQFSNFDPLNPQATRSIETFEFSDGSAISHEELIARGFYVGGANGDDYLYGSQWADRIYGYDGNDWLVGMAGNDILIGGSGSDQLDGGAGNDTYVFAPGDGFDSIWEGSGMPEAGGFDAVSLSGAHDPIGTQLFRYGNDLAIRSFLGDEVIVREHFGSYFDGSTRSAIEQITFSDGTIWDSSAINARVASMNSNMPTEGSDTVAGTPLSDYLYGMGGNDTISGGQGDDHLIGGTGNDRLFGGEGNDVLFGDVGNDLLGGGSGNDILNGGSGNDTYLFNSGNGQDRIEEYPVFGESNRVVFGAGIGFLDLQIDYTATYGGVTINVGTGGDQLVLSGAMLDPYAPRVVDTFEFADGTIATFDALAGYGVYFQGQQWDEWFSGSYYADSLYGNAGNDTLYGYSGNDILAGGQGNDYLSGGVGDDTYVFNLGDGMDIIDDYAMPGEGNRVRFGAGISLDNLKLRFDGWMGRLDIGAQGDSLHFSSFFPTDPLAPHSVEWFEFADGTSIRHADLIARGFQLDGTESYDYLIGTLLNDRIYGYGGDDTLVGMDGADILVGGTGSDQLYGGAGSDVYLLSAGDGFDTVWDGAGMPFDATGDVDVVRLGSGYDPALTQLLRFDNDLVIQNVQSGDQIVVREHFGSYYDGNTRSAIEQITFADGTIWDTAAINARLASMNSNMPSEGNDTIGGTPWNDFLNGMGGNDTLSGGQGDDFIFGGPGDDRLFGGEGADILLGDEGNDLLAGGSGNDILNGGYGNDSYLFNSGDGQDRIEEIPGTDQSNRVIFGQGIRFEDLSARLAPEIAGVVVDVGVHGDQLQITGALTGVYDQHAIDTFEFADGTVASFDAVMGYGMFVRGSEMGDWLTGTAYADSLYGNAGDDTLFGLDGNDVLAGGAGNDQLQGDSGDDLLQGGEGSDQLFGQFGNDELSGGAGNDYLEGGYGNDTYVFARGYGADVVSENDATAGNTDTVALGVNRLDVVLARSGSNLVMSLHGGTDTLTVQNWYSGSQYQTEIIQASDGSTLLNTQVEQLIQAMASFSTQTGLTWDQAIDQRPDEVQAVLAASWQAG